MQNVESAMWRGLKQESCVTHGFLDVDQHADDVGAANGVDGGHQDVGVVHVGVYFILGRAEHPVAPQSLHTKPLFTWTAVVKWDGICSSPVAVYML